MGYLWGYHKLYLTLEYEKSDFSRRFISDPDEICRNGLFCLNDYLGVLNLITLWWLARGRRDRPVQSNLWRIACKNTIF